MAEVELHLIFEETPSACQGAKPCTAVLAPWTLPLCHMLWNSLLWLSALMSASVYGLCKQTQSLQVGSQ